MVYRTQIPIRFSDVDPAGIAFYPTLVSFLHEAFEDFFEHSVGRHYATVIQDERIGFPAVDLKMKFLEPLRFGETVTVQVTVREVGRTSATFLYRLYKGADLHAEAEVTVVCVQLGTLEPMALPEIYREAFERVREDSPGDAS